MTICQLKLGDLSSNPVHVKMTLTLIRKYLEALVKTASFPENGQSALSLEDCRNLLKFLEGVWSQLEQTQSCKMGERQTSFDHVTDLIALTGLVMLLKYGDTSLVSILEQRKLMRVEFL